MTTIYFDIDGTLVPRDGGRAKRALADGGFERAIRPRFERIVCVGNFVSIVHVLSEGTVAFDGFEAIFSMCRGAFADEGWFRAHVELVPNPSDRASAIDLEADWWFVDDEADRYFRAAGRHEVLERERGRRIFVPDPTGDGDDILSWIASRDC